MNGLTDRQRLILDWIRVYIEDKGFPPGIREIGRQFHIHSTNGVLDHLRSLERKGFITREATKSRAIRIVGQRAPLVMDDDDDGVMIPVYDQRSIAKAIRDAEKNDAPGLEPEASVGVTNSAREGTATRSAGRAR